MQKRKWLFVFVTISVMILGGCGLANNTKYSTKAQVQMAKDLLKEKYGEEFEISAIGARYGTLSNSTYKVVAYPVNNPKLIFAAEISKEGSYFHDEYIKKIVCNELTEDIVSKISFDATFFISCLPNTFEIAKNDITLNELVAQNSKTEFVIWMVYSNDTELTDIITALNDIFASYPNLNGEIRYYVVDDKSTVEEFGKLAGENITFIADMQDLLSGIKEQKLSINNGRISSPE